MKSSARVKASVSKVEIKKFQKEVWDFYRKNGRHNLPWRQTKDPYRILVSELMLQQTQVARVLEKYKSLLKKFPTVRTLAKAPLAAVLKEWSGLGYNRRGKYLHDTARAIVGNHYGKVPKDIVELRELPGMGPYTASAVRVFAFNLPDVLIETNVRSAYIHWFFSKDVSLSPHGREKIGTPKQKKVTDSKLLPLIKEAAAGEDPRTWNWALMDYGAHTKKLHKNLTGKSAEYVVQSKFQGSQRQVRGAILKLLHTGEHGDRALAQKLSFDEFRVREALNSLARDGLVTAQKGSWSIA